MDWPRLRCSPARVRILDFYGWVWRQSVFTGGTAVLGTQTQEHPRGCDMERALSTELGKPLRVQVSQSLD